MPRFSPAENDHDGPKSGRCPNGLPGKVEIRLPAVDRPGRFHAIQGLTHGPCPDFVHNRCHKETDQKEKNNAPDHHGIG